MAQRNSTNSKRTSRSQSAQKRNSDISSETSENMKMSTELYAQQRNLNFNLNRQLKPNISWSTNKNISVTGRKTEPFADLIPDELKIKDRNDVIGGNLSFTLPYAANGFNNYTPKYSQNDPMANRINKPGSFNKSFSNPNTNTNYGNDPFASVQFDEWKEKVDIWFKEADLDSNGLVSGEEAVQFFKRSDLATEKLSEMWNCCMPMGCKAMDKTAFERALKLVAMLQNNVRLTSDTVSKAAIQPYPSPLPKISDKENDKNDDSDFDDSSSASTMQSEEPACSRAQSLPTVTGDDSALSWLNQGGHLDLGLRTHAINLDMAESQDLVESSAEDEDEDGMPTVGCTLVSVDLRLPSLDPKNAPRLRRLIESNKSLLAYPNNGSHHNIVSSNSTNNSNEKSGFLQWVDICTTVPLTMNSNSSDFGHCKNEDWDSTPCHEVSVKSIGTITCSLYDEASERLWIGSDQGIIAAYYVSGDPNVLSGTDDYVNSWKSHKHGYITAMVLTSWGNLWSSSSRGSLRKWNNPGHTGKVNGTPLRTKRGDKAHYSIQAMVLSTCGSLVWTAGQNSIAIWDAYSGTYLGKIEKAISNDYSNVQQVDERYMRIDPKKGLEVNEATGRVRILNRGNCKYSEDESDRSDVENSTNTKKKIIIGIDRFRRMIEKGGNIRKKLLESRAHQPANMSVTATEEKSSTLGTIKDMAALPDLSIWVGYKNGYLERYCNNGRYTYRTTVGVRLNCLCTVGDRLWVGLRDGSICVIGSEAKEIMRWSAHEASVLDIEVVGPLVYSLAADGSIKGWSSSIPHPVLDKEAWKKLNSNLRDVIKQYKFRILCGTWNVNETRPSQESLRNWLGDDNQISKAHIIVVGLQEVELGAGSVAMTVAYDRFSKSILEKGNSNAQWWATEILKAISPTPNEIDRDPWHRICLRQMSGILIYVFVRKSIEPYIGNIASAHVGCGVMGRGGNKGAVAATFTIYRRRFVVLSSHFAAHQDAIAKRNSNYRAIRDTMTFVKEKSTTSPSSNTNHNSNIYTGSTSAAVPVLTNSSRCIQTNSITSHMSPTSNYMSLSSAQRSETGRSLEMLEDEEHTSLNKGIQSADVIVWLGDFNYRVNMGYQEAINKIKEGNWSELLSYDQCRQEMVEGRVFRGLKEGKIKFLPTYKFNKGDKGDNNTFGYDSSEKMRVPSYTDRIFFRGSKPFMLNEIFDDENKRTSLITAKSLENKEDLLIDIDDKRPSFISKSVTIVGSTRHRDPDEITVECEEYDACMSVYDSDHKPVKSLLTLDFPSYIQEKKRNLCFKILKQFMESEESKLSVNISMKYLDFLGSGTKDIEVSNNSNCKVLITVKSDQALNRYMPQWLEATPTQVILTPNGKRNIRFIADQGPIQGSVNKATRVNASLVLRAQAILYGWKYVFNDFKIGAMLRLT